MKMGQQKHIIAICVIILAVGALSSSSVSARVYPTSASKAITHYTRGVMNDLLGLTQEAIEEYEKAASLDKTSYAVHLRLGVDYARVGKLYESIEELNLVTQYNPDDIQSRYLLALVYSTLKQFDKAAQQYESILKHFSKKDPKNIEIHGYLAQLYYSQKNLEKAIGQFESILNLEPENADVMYLLGSLYLEVDQKDTAIEMFKKSIDIDSEHDGSLNSLGYIYAEDGAQLDEAEALITRALDIDPENGAYLDSLGWIYFKQKKYEEALKYLLSANTSLEDPIIYDHLGDVYYKMGQIKEAQHYWKSSLEMDPDKPEITQKLENLEKQQVSK